MQLVDSPPLGKKNRNICKDPGNFASQEHLMHHGSTDFGTFLMGTAIWAAQSFQEQLQALLVSLILARWSACSIQ